jgi:hypothetical protein
MSAKGVNYKIGNKVFTSGQMESSKEAWSKFGQDLIQPDIKTDKLTKDEIVNPDYVKTYGNPFNEGEDKLNPVIKKNTRKKLIEKELYQEQLNHKKEIKPFKQIAKEALIRKGNYIVNQGINKEYKKHLIRLEFKGDEEELQNYFNYLNFWL